MVGWGPPPGTPVICTKGFLFTREAFVFQFLYEVCSGWDGMGLNARWRAVRLDMTAVMKGGDHNYIVMTGGGCPVGVGSGVAFVLTICCSTFRLVTAPEG